MASVTWDSELMTNYAEAVAVPKGKKLIACVDNLNKQPAVFCLSNHGIPKLQVIRVDKDGRRVLLDLGPLLGLSDNSIIEAFDVHQSPDLTIFLCFSIKLDERNSELWVIQPFKLAATITLTALPRRSFGRLHAITIGPHAADGSSYSAIYLMHQPLNRTAQNSDLARIQIYREQENWNLEEYKDLTLPVNVQKILDIAPAFAGFYGHGLIYLCEQNGKRSLYANFIRSGEQLGDRGTASQYKLPCPEDASSISTFIDYTDNDNRSSLLIGCGDGVRLIHGREMTGITGISPILLNNGESLTDTRDLYVTQTEEELSLFAINGKKELVFLTTSFKDIQNARAAPIMPSGSVTTFSAMIACSNNNTHHSLVCNDESGNLTLLQQALETGIWREQPFYVEAGGTLTPFQSYTVTIAAKDVQKNPIINGKIQLQAPSSLPVILNGRFTTLSPTATWYNLDNAGEIGLIIPTKQISSQLVAVKGLRDAGSKSLGLKGLTIDPTSKVLSRMSSLSSETALLEAKTPDGKSLWDGTTRPVGEDLKNAALSFHAIIDAHATLPKDGSKVKSENTTEKNLEVSKEPASTGNIFMDAFNWIKSKANNIKKWIIRKAGQVWEFVCEIGGKAMNFVLDCLEKVTEAASWVWEKLKVGWDKLCQFAGFLFSWNDILETKTTIVKFLNAGLDMAANKIEGFNSSIDNLFSNIQQTVADATGATSRPEYKNKILSTVRKEDQEMNDLQDSAPSKWIGERMKNGNAIGKGVTGKPISDTRDNESAELVKIWTDRVEPIIKDFTKLVEDLAVDIAQLFKEDKNLSQEALLMRMSGNLLVNILEVVKKLLQAVVSVVAKVILIVKEFGNARLSGGFLNSLYKLIGEGQDLTIFEAVSLLIAIPSTIIIKIVTGAKPPTFTEVNAEFMESIIEAKNEDVSDGALSKVNKGLMKDVTILVLGCGCGAALLSVFVKNVKVVWKTATVGISAGVGTLSPSAIMELFGMAIDAFSLYKDILVDPVAEGTPGKDFIDIATAVKCFRLATNALYMLATKIGLDNPVAEQIVLCIDALAGLINFLLYSAVYAEQLDAISWAGYDEDILTTAAVDNFLEVLATLGYFTAASLKEKTPPVALVGMACFQVAAWGGVVTKGISFRSEYKKL